MASRMNQPEKPVADRRLDDDVFVGAVILDNFRRFKPIRRGQIEVDLQIPTGRHGTPRHHGAVGHRYQTSDERAGGRQRDGGI